MTDVPITPIRTLLVANRGEIAVRVMATAREMGIRTVAVYSDPDAAAPHVAAADLAVYLPGSTPAETYLRGDAVIAAALATGADAIHPGYGFLSENAGFARACAAAGVTFVGPSPEAIDAMGSKIAAKELMAAAGVPVLPGATVAQGDDVTALGARVGFPLIVKAAFGGGGRGMRVVTDPATLDEAVASAQREAASAFGDGTVFMERFVSSPRHVEVQIFGDHHGTVIHLFERECSIQRRHQKIIEEAPSPVVTPEVRAALGEAAVTAARTLGYVGAGTVEFVMAPDLSFAFLEVNTRLQVEHPVTEAITGLDLVRLQLTVAEGRPLPPDAVGATITGHAIEARLYAEDVAAGFLPVSGSIDRLRVDAPGVRVDTGYADGSTVSTFYDAMLAKVIAWAPTRDEATRKLADALAGAHVHGITTNRTLLVGILRHPEFAAGATDTGFLERHDPAALGGPPAAVAVHAVAAALARRAHRATTTAVLPGVPAGWRNVATAPQRISFEHGGTRVEVGYTVDRTGMSATVDGVVVDGLELLAATGDEVVLGVGGVRHRVSVHAVADPSGGERVHVDSVFGATSFRVVERFPVPVPQIPPGSLMAPLPGTVVRVLHAVGDRVAAGATLVVLEAMKLEHVIRPPEAGIVTSIAVAVGDQVETGSVLATVTPEADSDG